jgi:hypothetical protein
MVQLLIQSGRVNWSIYDPHQRAANPDNAHEQHDDWSNDPDHPLWVALNANPEDVDMIRILLQHPHATIPMRVLTWAWNGKDKRMLDEFMKYPDASHSLLGFLMMFEDLNGIEELAQNFAIPLDAKDPLFGKSLIHLAVDTKNYRFLKFLHQQGFDLSRIDLLLDDFQQTPLHLAVMNKFYLGITYLMREWSGAMMAEMEDRYGLKPLWHAMQQVT